MSKLNPENIWTSSITCTQQAIFKNIYEYTNIYVHETTSNGQGHEFEGDQGNTGDLE